MHARADACSGSTAPSGGLPYDECGKLVVAVDPAELGRFDALERTARENGVPGLVRVEGTGITDIEPAAAGLVALHSPATAITDYAAVARAYADDIVEAGGEVMLSTEVTGIRRGVGGIEVATSGRPPPLRPARGLCRAAVRPRLPARRRRRRTADRAVPRGVHERRTRTRPTWSAA